MHISGTIGLALTFRCETTTQTQTQPTDEGQEEDTQYWPQRWQYGQQKTAAFEREVIQRKTFENEGL